MYLKPQKEYYEFSGLSNSSIDDLCQKELSQTYEFYKDLKRIGGHRLNKDRLSWIYNWVRDEKDYELLLSIWRNKHFIPFLKVEEVREYLLYSAHRERSNVIRKFCISLSGTKPGHLRVSGFVLSEMKHLRINRDGEGFVTEEILTPKGFISNHYVYKSFDDIYDQLKSSFSSFGAEYDLVNRPFSPVYSFINDESIEDKELEDYFRSLL